MTNPTFPFLESMNYPYWLWWDYSVSEDNRMVSDLPTLLRITHQECNITEESIFQLFNIALETLENIDFDCTCFNLFEILSKKSQLKYLHEKKADCIRLLESMLSIAKTGCWDEKRESIDSHIRLFREHETRIIDLRKEREEKESTALLSSIYKAVTNEVLC